MYIIIGLDCERVQVACFETDEVIGFMKAKERYPNVNQFFAWDTTTSAFVMVHRFRKWLDCNGVRNVDLVLAQLRSYIASLLKSNVNQHVQGQS